MTDKELRARLTGLGLVLPESDLQPLLTMVEAIEQAALDIRRGLELSDEPALIFPAERLAARAL